MSLENIGIKIGKLAIDKKYIMDKNTMESLGSAENMPELFPIYCKDDGNIYIYYRAEDGSHVVNFNDLIGNIGTHTILYPIVNEETNQISWELRENVGEVPEPVTLKGEKGDSAYKIWLDQGNIGTESDFLSSIVDPTRMNSDTIESFKNVLGINEMKEKLDYVAEALNSILG